MAKETKKTNVIIPEVMADMVKAVLNKKIAAMPYVRTDDTLEGVPGDEITVPQWVYIGDAAEVAEGEEAEATVMSATTTKTKVKKAVKRISLTDEILLCGYGDPLGNASEQIGMSLQAKMDSDFFTEMFKASNVYDGSSAIISYEAIVNAVDKFQEEGNVNKVIFIHPAQLTQLRLDPNFIDKTKYGNDVLMTGEIGMIANCRVVPTLKAALGSGSTFYQCPIIQIDPPEVTDTAIPALTLYLKRNVMIETDRVISKGLTDIVGSVHYAAAVSNQSKLVLAKFKKAAA